MSHDVFLSYSHTDSSVARELRKELKKVELTCFMAEIDIDPGEAWEEKIRSVIPNVKSVILLITPRSRDSHWLALEAGAAWVHEIPIICATIYVDVDELPSPFTKLQSMTVESIIQKRKLAVKLSPKYKFKNDDIGGCWNDDRNYTIFFQQNNGKVIGFYDMGSGKKVGIYLGTIKGKIVTFRWKRLNEPFSGEGTMFLKDAKTLEGNLQRIKPEEKLDDLKFNRFSLDRPAWLSEKDFLNAETYFKTAK
jgi:hypothetical protein